MDSQSEDNGEGNAFISFKFSFLITLNMAKMIVE